MHQYFCAASLIWQAYFDKKISMQRRDDLLDALRREWGFR